MKIKEKVLNESFEWMFQHTYRDSKNLKESINMPSATSYEVSQSIKRAIDLTLAQVKKVIDEEIKKEQKCMDRDDFEVQILEHTNQIEMAKKLKQKLSEDA